MHGFSLGSSHVGFSLDRSSTDPKGCHGCRITHRAISCRFDSGASHHNTISNLNGDYSGCTAHTTTTIQHRARYSGNTTAILRYTTATLIVTATNLFTMESQLKNRLLNLNLRDEPDVTRNSVGECLFLCFAQFLKQHNSLARAVTREGDALYVVRPSQQGHVVAERERLDVSSVAGLRLLAADTTRAILTDITPTCQAPLLRKHILHRFRSAFMRDRDAQVDGFEPPPDDASEPDKVRAWCKLMETAGVL